MDSASAYHTAKMTKTKKREASYCPEELSTDVEMNTETEEAKKTMERQALMFVSSEDSEIDKEEVPTPRRRRNKGTEADAKAGST